jgi:NADH:ubiquinone oxidoreductase subunit F (NADH-binding)
MSGLRGRGGAGFPTGIKWSLARKAHGDRKFVLCNADEGDPGAFMDRSVLEGDPHSVIEAMAIAAYAIGASQGYVYVRAEYPLAVKRLAWRSIRRESMDYSEKTFSVRGSTSIWRFEWGPERLFAVKRRRS